MFVRKVSEASRKTIKLPQAHVEVLLVEPPQTAHVSFCHDPCTEEEPDAYLTRNCPPIGYRPVMVSRVELGTACV